MLENDANDTMYTRKGEIMNQILAYADNLEYLFEQGTSMLVHSVYKHTINLISGNQMIALTPRQSILTPLSIQLDLSDYQFAKLAIKQNDEVKFNTMGLQIQGQEFSLLLALGYYLNIRNFSKVSLEDACEIQRLLATTLFKQAAKGELVQAAMYVLFTHSIEFSLQQTFFASSLKEFLRAETEESLIQILTNFIGAGEGLTPAGDDFITGVIASNSLLPWISSDGEEILTKEIVLKSNKTTLISQHYLLHATQGRFNKLVVEFMDLCRTNLDIVPVLNEIRAIGHSSGTDFLLGVYFGLKRGGIESC